MAPSSISTEELYVTKESDEVGVIIKLEKISIVVPSNLTTYSLEDFQALEDDVFTAPENSQRQERGLSYVRCIFAFNISCIQ